MVTVVDVVNAEREEFVDRVDDGVRDGCEDAGESVSRCSRDTPSKLRLGRLSSDFAEATEPSAALSSSSSSSISRLLPAFRISKNIVIRTDHLKEADSRLLQFESFVLFPEILDNGQTGRLLALESRVQAFKAIVALCRCGHGRGVSAMERAGGRSGSTVLSHGN